MDPLRAAGEVAKLSQSKLGKNEMAVESFSTSSSSARGRGYITPSGPAQLGFKTAIVERDYPRRHLLNWGCIPTKALLRSAELYHDMQHRQGLRLKADNVVYYRRRRSVNLPARRHLPLQPGVGFLSRKTR